MFLAIIFLPLIASFLAGLFGHYTGRNGARFVTIFGMLVNLSLVLFLIGQYFHQPEVIHLKTGTWMASEMLQLSWSFNLDAITLTMFFVVNLIFCLVHIYSSSYMSEDPHLPRFMSYLSLFTNAIRIIYRTWANLAKKLIRSTTFTSGFPFSLQYTLGLFTKAEIVSDKTGQPKIIVPGRPLCQIWPANNQTEWFFQAVKEAERIYLSKIGLLLLFFVIVYCLARVNKQVSPKNLLIRIFLILFSLWINLLFLFPWFFAEQGCFWWNIANHGASPLRLYREHIITFLRTSSFVMLSILFYQLVLFFGSKFGVVTKVKNLLLRWVPSIGKRFNWTVQEFTAASLPEITPFVFAYPCFVGVARMITSHPSSLFVLMGLLFFWIVFSIATTIKQQPDSCKKLFCQICDIPKDAKYQNQTLRKKVVIFFVIFQVVFVGLVAMSPWFVSTFLIYVGLFFREFSLAVLYRPDSPGFSFDFLTLTYTGQIINILGSFIGFYISNLAFLILIVKKKIRSPIYELLDQETLYQLFGNPGKELVKKAGRLATGVGFMFGLSLLTDMSHHQTQRRLMNLTQDINEKRWKNGLDPLTCQQVLQQTDPKYGLISNKVEKVEVKVFKPDYWTIRFWKIR